MKAVVRIVELMYAIFIYEAWVSGPWTLTSGLLNFVSTTCLMKESVRTGTHIVRTVAAVFSVYVLKRNLLTCQTLKNVRTCCWDVRTDATWNSSKLLDTKGRPDENFLSSERMMLDRWASGRKSTSSKLIQGNWSIHFEFYTESSRSSNWSVDSE
jgi:hypothetical protein